MGRVIAYRLATAAPLLLATSFFSFLLLHLAPGTFLDALRWHPGIPESVVSELARNFGLDRPWYAQYGAWIAGVLRGDFGVSLQFQRPVVDLLVRAVPRTLALATAGELAASVLGMTLALLSMRRPRGRLDRGLYRASVALASVHPVVLANLALVAAFVTGFLPVGGGSSAGAAAGGRQLWGDYLAHLVLPASVLALVMLPGFLLQARGALDEALQAPFVVAARATGLSEERLLLRHALPAAGVPLLGYAGASLARLLSASFLVEVVTGWPGMGPLALGALSNRDPFLMLGALLLSAALLVVGQLVADVALAGADPRIRLEESAP